DRGSGDVVPAAPNGDRQSVLARVRDGGDHVRIAGATHDQRRTAVDHAVPDPTCSVVAAVTFGDHLSSHPLPQLVQLNGLGYRHARLLLAVDVVRYVSPAQRRYKARTGRRIRLEAMPETIAET